MKHLSLLSFLLLVASLQCRGQYEPFLQEGKVWNIRYSNFFTETEYDTRLLVRGDTVVNGHLCKKVYGEESSSLYLHAFLYEDGRRVYRCWADREASELLYDFGCSVGDTVSLSWCDLIVTDVDTVECGGRLLRRISLKERRDAVDYIWVEGVGSTADMISNIPMPGNYNHFVSCELGGQTLYDSRVFSAPPYTSAVLAPEPDITPADAACIPQPGQTCNLQGRRLTGLPRKGVYVR